MGAQGPPADNSAWSESSLPWLVLPPFGPSSASIPASFFKWGPKIERGKYCKAGFNSLLFSSSLFCLAPRPRPGSVPGRPRPWNPRGLRSWGVSGVHLPRGRQAWGPEGPKGRKAKGRGVPVLLAQLVERGIENPCVGGSTPPEDTRFGPSQRGGMVYTPDLGSVCWGFESLRW